MRWFSIGRKARKKRGPELLQDNKSELLRDDNKSELVKDGDESEPEKDENPAIKVPPGLKLPQWFLDSCVQTAEELKQRRIPLTVKPEPSNVDGVDLLSNAEETDHYEVDSVLYQPLLDLASPFSIRTDAGNGSDNNNGKVFLKYAAHLCHPDGLFERGSDQFWIAIVEHFAQQIQADLITLDVNILEDLDEYLGEDVRIETQAAVSAILASPNLKLNETSTHREPTHRRVMVIHLLESDQLYYFRRTLFLFELREALEAAKQDIIVLSTTVEPQSDPSSTIISGSGVRARAIILAPICNPAQKALLAKHRKSYDSFEQKNIRSLKRRVRRSHERYRNFNLLLPSTKWDFLAGTAAQQFFAEKKLISGDIDELLCGIDRDLEENELKQKILAMVRRRTVLETWDGRTRTVVQKTERTQWSGFPPEVQYKIQGVENDSGDLKWEKRFLNLIVKPDELGEGWSDIAIDPEIKSLIIKLIHQPPKSDTSARGILKRERIGGALLYGPPGTGKTHLARVLARESSTVMICVSAADLESKWVGETEKAIQGLFNLGRLLAPSAIFIDEADALFRSRSSDDQSWERNKTNQLLSEIDGLKKDTSQAFILLATNNPHDLDTAVLRRAPSRIYIGLPSLKQRAQIFRICLRDENVDSTVDYQTLAERTTGYSGSDIRTLCVQWALTCDDSPDSASDRILKQSDFDKVLRRCSPTVSKKTLAEIKAFAKVYDPGALKEMEKREVKETKQSPPRVVAQSTPVITKSVKASSHYLNATDVDGTTAQTDLLLIGNSDPSTNGDGKNNAVQAAGKFQYTPLQPNGRHIRILSVECATEVSRNREGDPLRCTLKTVDLGDWTTEYRRFMVETADLNLSHKSRLEYWQRLSAIRRGIPGIEHQSVDNGDLMQWMRLFELHMDTSREFPVRANTDIIPRYSWGDYVALSYVWGSSGNKRDIILNGHLFSITSNLYDALLAFRESIEASSVKMCIWADAICINQEDLHERAAEVKKMSLVYSNSFIVRAWLGQSTDEFPHHAMNEVLDFLERTEMSDDLREGVKEEGLWDSFQEVTAALILLPFWRRTWIAQEVALAPSMLFCYDKYTFTLRALLKLLVGHWAENPTMQMLENSWAFYDDLAHKLTNTVHVSSFLLFLLAQRYYSTELQDSTRLNALLMMAQFSHATDPRDKVYGFLSLLPEPIVAQIQPDYSTASTAQKVFVAFSKACFEAQGDLELFRLLGHQPASNVEGLPSWALNMYSGHEHARQRFRPILGRSDPQANLNLSSAQIDYSADDQLMFCDGVIVDEMNSLGKYMAIDSRTGVKSHGDFHRGVPLVAASANQDWRLSLVRVLLRDPLFNFSDGVSIFDFPWDEIDKILKEDTIFQTCDHPLFKACNENMESCDFEHFENVWEQILRFLGRNKDFEFGGRALATYFDATEVISWTEMARLTKVLRGAENDGQLFTTMTGRLGTGPCKLEPGDKVVVFADCCSPIVLRPHGPHYRVLGPCWVDGLMTGEVAGMVHRGEMKPERISIC